MFDLAKANLFMKCEMTGRKETTRTMWIARFIVRDTSTLSGIRFFRIST